ncbi:hypothetical protein ABZ829_35950 [Streptomyces xanthochromogenes]|uniref:hypothetical protein n=1 Tax=Streptomyces xanthochromogenes TaxID=67384 RepID=UPI0034288913
MAITPARTALFTTITGVVALSVGFTTLAVAQAEPHSTAPATTTSDIPSAVERFTYPGAAQILNDRKISLKRGDGHIQLTNCDSPWDIQIESRTGDEFFCFTVSGNRGFLTMELPKAHSIWTKDHPVQAKITANGKETIVNAPKDELTPMGETGDTHTASTLVELRVTS